MKFDRKHIRAVAKAIAGAIVAGAGATGTVAVVVPPEISVPWWGYVTIAVINAAIGYAGVYAAPENVPLKGKPGAG